MAVPGPAPPRPPRRVLPRIAGALTQLSCGLCLLIGTIALVLVQQNKTGNLGVVALWLAMAMAGLVFGGLIHRGGLVNMLIAAAINIEFGIALCAIEADTLRKLLKILPDSDVEAIGGVLLVFGIVMFCIAAVCFAALPEGIRYADWFRQVTARNAMSTARGFPPPPATRGTAYMVPDDRRMSQRSVYMILGGLAIGVGMGIGVLVSSSKLPDEPRAASTDGRGSGGAVAATARTAVAADRPADGAAGGAGGEAGIGSASAATTAVAAPMAAGSAGSAAGAATGSASVVTTPVAVPIEAAGSAAPSKTVQDLLVAQRAAFAQVDVKALSALVFPRAFGFGVDADEVADDRDAVLAQIARDLGEPPAGGFTVESKALAVGEEREHAWIADELEVTAPGGEPRRFEVSELAAVIDGAWRVVALHWAIPVDDATAERMAILGTLPTPQPIANRVEGSAALDQAALAAFTSRAVFADARSERPDAFNLGSGGERVRGGVAIKRLFGKLRAQIRQHDGARIVAGGAWDPAQRTEPWIGWAAVNVDFTARTRAQTDVTQTFRVLAIFIKDGADWKIVQTHWSNGGPIR